MAERVRPLRIAREFSAWACGRRRRVVVGGRSMLPTLEPGWFVLFEPAGEATDGQVVVATHPDSPDTLIVKRLSGGRLCSDNPVEGTDFDVTSTVLGPVTLVLDHPRQVLTRP